MNEFRSEASGGFTAIELLVVIALMAIAMVIAIPGMGGFVRANRVQGEMDQLGEAIRYARAQAVRQGATVILCSATQGRSCDAGNVWSQGWIIFSDANRNGEPDPGELLRIGQGFSGGDLLSASSDGSRLKFNRDGFAFDLPTSGTLVFTLTTTPADTMAQRCLSINMTGHFSILKAGHADCT